MSIYWSEAASVVGWSRAHIARMFVWTTWLPPYNHPAALLLRSTGDTEYSAPLVACVRVMKLVGAFREQSHFLMTRMRRTGAAELLLPPAQGHLAGGHLTTRLVR